MCFFLVLFWCSAVADDAGALPVFAVIPRFGEFDSRLGGREFPVHFTTGNHWQGLDLLYRFFSQIAVAWGTSTKFPVSTGKTGNFARQPQRCLACLLTGRSEEALAHARRAIEGNRNFVVPNCVLALGCTPFGRGEEAAQALRRLVRVGSLRKIGLPARPASDLDLPRGAHLPG